MNSLKRIDIVFFSYLFFTTCLLLLNWHALNNSNELVLIRIVIIFAVIGLIFLNLKTSSQFLAFIRNTYPLLLSGYFYAETVFYNKLFFKDIDPWLTKIEAFIFGFQPSVTFSNSISTKWFSELMYFGYFSFYLLIIGLVLFVYFSNRKHFTKVVFKLSASLYIFYIIFSLIPSAGPQFYFSNPENILPKAYIFDKIIHFIQHVAEQPTGAFPSSHVAIAAIILILSKRDAPLFFKIALPIVFVLMVSTVYIKAHYAIDIFAGLLIAPLIIYISDILFRINFWNPNKSIR